jgi:hypothetical protein
MSTNWLNRSRTAPKIDTSTVKALCGQLEATYQATRQHRQQIDEDFGTQPSGVRNAQMAQLQRAASGRISDLQAQIRQAFAALKVQADAHRADARRDFHTGSEGRSYREALASYSTLAQRMTPDQIASKIDDALAAGLQGEARAWSELARSQVNVPTGNLFLALDAADTYGRSDLESAADDGYAMIDAATRRFGTFSLTATNRLDRALADQADPAAGNFDGGNIFADGGE